MNLIKICEERQKMMVTELIGLAEAQRKIYDALKIQPKVENSKFMDAYNLHVKELELLIKYQSEKNGD